MLPLEHEQNPMTQRHYGSNYDPSLDVKTIAMRCRNELAALSRAGSLPATAKWSVTLKRYSGGRSTRADLVEWPTPVLNPAWIEHRRAHPNEPTPRGVRRWAADVETALKTANAILRAYNYDGSDAMTDYFDVHFYQSVEVARELEERAIPA